MPEEIPRWRARLADNREARRWNLTSLLLTLPLLLVGYYNYAGDALRVAAVAVLTAAATEFVAGRLIWKRRSLDDFNAVAIGLWIACMLPAATALPANNAPLYAIAGSMFAVLVAKIPFGGTAHAPFTPAAAGFAFLTVCFPHRVFAYLPSEIAPPLHGRSLALLLQQGRSVVDGRQLAGVLLGQTMGPMGTGGILMIAVVLLVMFLLKERRGPAFASLGFVAAVALLAFLIPRANGTGVPSIWGDMSIRLSSVGMELCSGSLLFAAVFLLPDPAILPGRWFTRFGLGAFAGALCILLRYIGSFEESVCFAILLADAAMPLFYRIQSEIHQVKSFREIIMGHEAPDGWGGEEMEAQ